MAKAIADRLAEVNSCLLLMLVRPVTTNVELQHEIDVSLQSFAEMLHETVRKDLWGYAGDEVLTAAEMHKIKYEVSCLKHTM